MPQAFFNLLSENSSLILLTFSVIMVLSIAWNVYLQVQFQKMREKQRIFLQGKEGQDLEQLILEGIAEIKKLDKDIEELYGISESIHKIALKGVQKIGLVRFNPFKDTGGNQSFAVALLNASNSGVIISSLYSREGTRVYSKPIKEGSSQYQLSEEENQAIAKAIDGK